MFDLTSQRSLILRFAALLLALAAACGAQSDAATDTTASVATKSLGVGENWTVDSLEFLRVTGITTVDSLVPVSDVRGLSRLPDGGVVVADGRTSTLEFFNAEGEYARTVGKKGSGKDELLRLTHMMRCGDLLYVQDLTQRDYQVFSDSGVGVRPIPVPVDSTGEIATRSACNADGLFINYLQGYTFTNHGNSPATHVPARFWLTTATGALQANLRNHQDAVQSMARSTNPKYALPLVHEAYVAIGRNKAYVGTADDFTINVYSLNGDSVGMIQKTIRARLSTPADLERYKFRNTVGRPAAEVVNGVSNWRTVRFPETLPAYTAMVLDSADNLWVRAQPPASPDFSPAPRV